MKIEKASSVRIPLRRFQRALSVVSSVVERKSPVPALGAVRIKANGGIVEFAATSSSSLSAKAVVRSEEMEGDSDAILLSAHKLESYSRLLQGDEVLLDRRGSKRVGVHCGTSSTTLASIVDSAFPLIENPPSDTLFSIGQETAARALKFTAFAAGTDDKKPHLRGALLEIGDGNVQFVTTDGFRLARYRWSTDASDVKLLIPEPLLASACRALDLSGRAGYLSIHATAETVFACVEEGADKIELSHRVVDGQFPNYRAVIPARAEASVQLEAPALEGAVRRCVSIADSKTQALRLNVSPGELKIEAADASTGVTTETLQVAAASQFTPFTAMFRGEYLLDVLSRIRGPITLGFAKIAGATGLLIVHSPVAGETFEHVLLGIRH